MRKLLHGIARIETWGPLLVAAIAFTLAGLFISREDIALVVRAVDIAAWIAICMAYLPVLIEVLRSPQVKKDQHILMGILVLWNALGFASIWFIIYILMGRPAYMQDSLFPSFCWLAIAFSSYYFIKVPGTSKVGWTYTAFAFALSIVLIVIFYRHL